MEITRDRKALEAHNIATNMQIQTYEQGIEHSIDLSKNMARSTYTCRSKHRHKTQAYPSPRRLGQHYQSIKTWQKVRRQARKTIKHARKQDKARKNNKATYKAR